MGTEYNSTKKKEPWILLGQPLSVKVTGGSENGLAVLIKDEEYGAYILCSSSKPGYIARFVEAAALIESAIKDTELIKLEGTYLKCPDISKETFNISLVSAKGYTIEL